MTNSNNRDGLEIARNFVQSTGILEKSQLYSYLNKKSFDEETADKIFKILVNRKYISAMSDYLIANKLIPLNEYDEKKRKSIWCFIDLDVQNTLLEEENSTYTFHCKYPASFSATYVDDSKLKNIVAFYIKSGEEKILSHIINTSFSLSDEKIDCIIILDSTDSIDKICLPDNFNVLYYATTDNEGNVNRYIIK